jgi:hypothetical protein
MRAVARAAIAAATLLSPSVDATEPTLLGSTSYFDQNATNGPQPARQFDPGRAVLYLPLGGPGPGAALEGIICGFRSQIVGMTGELEWRVVATGCPTRAKQCRAPAILDPGDVLPWTVDAPGVTVVRPPYPAQELFDQVPDRCCLAVTLEGRLTSDLATDEANFYCGASRDETRLSAGTR